MTHAQRRQGMGVGILLLLTPWAPALGQRAEPPPDDAGVVWRLVRGGGGFSSPGGTTGMGLESVASNGELFVAVGERGTIVRSSDGNNWSEARFRPAAADFTEVVWGGGRFVAIGGATIVSSADGDSWERSRTANTDRWNGVAWGHDRFVAVGTGAIAHSRDGRRWHRVPQRATPASLLGITWGGGRFVAVGNDGVIVYSADGEHWQTSRDTGTSTALLDVVWNGERYVAVGEGIILRSSNGKRWDVSRSDIPPQERLNDVVWAGGRFVAVGNRILHSSDGDLWETATVQVDGKTFEAAPLVWLAGGGWISRGWDHYLHGIAWNRAGFVAVGMNGAILISSDGLQWEQASDSGALLPELVGVAWGGERFVALADWSDSILHSADGQRWQNVNVGPELYGINDVVWAGDRFVAVGIKIASSADGVRWQEVSASLDEQLSAVAWNGQDLVAVGYEGTIMRSGDGERWTSVADSATTEHLSDVVWGGKRFVAVGFNGVIVHSDDGERWRPASGPASRPAVSVRAAPRNRATLNGHYSGVAWNGKRFVAVGWGGYGDHRVGTVVHSKDGDRWELANDHEFLAEEHFGAVAWNGRRLAAVSYFDGTIMYSADGDRWDPASKIATFDKLNDIAWGNRRFVAVGRNGTIVVSP